MSSKPHTHGTGSAFYSLDSDLLPALTAADISWASCARVINQRWICHGRKGPCHPLQRNSYSHSGAEAILGWLHNYHMLVLNPALSATVLGLNTGSSLVTSAPLCWPWISLLQWSSPLVIWTHQSIAALCSWVLLPHQGLPWDLGAKKKNPQAAEDSGWENLLLEIPSWHSLLISFCSLRNLESCPEKLVLDSAGFHSWLSVK